MNTKLIMTSSAIVMGATGLVLTFASDNILDHFGASWNKLLQLLLQILGALYFAFAMLNWMSRTNAMGGIYSNPLVAANMTHFLIGGLALTKALMSDAWLPKLTWVIAVIYITFALTFGLLFFRSPVSKI